jgi:predicted amidohydrolase YtcJ
VTDLLVVGKITTQDPSLPYASAVAIHDGAVAAVGELSTVRSTVPPGTPVLDFPYVAPGFVDSHVHLLWAGRRASRLVLDDSTGLAPLRAFAWADPAAQWVEADAAFEGPLPTAAELEAAAPGVAVVLDRKGHDALVSLTALRRAGIGVSTADPIGGRIDRLADGTPSGLLVEQPAVALVRAVMPEPSGDVVRGWIDAGQRELLGHGITTAIDPAVDAAGLAAYAEMARTARLRMRVIAMPPAWPADFVSADPGRLRLGPLKIFLDGGGSLGTALLSRPWPGTDGYHGNQSVPTADLLERCLSAAAAGRGVGVHAVGDAAVDLVLDVLTEVDRQYPLAGLGFHLIHAYLGPSPTAMRRAAALGIPVSAHPALQWAFGAGLVSRLGPTLAAEANPLRSWLDAGVQVAGGSDGPGPPMSVLKGMWQARTRRVRDLPSPLGPAQAVTAAEALDLFTTSAARLAAMSGTGRIRVGEPADLVGLDVDPLSPDPDALAVGKVLATIVAGAVA